MGILYRYALKCTELLTCNSIYFLTKWIDYCFSKPFIEEEVTVVYTNIHIANEESMFCNIMFTDNGFNFQLLSVVDYFALSYFISYAVYCNLVCVCDISKKKYGCCMYMIAASSEELALAFLFYRLRNRKLLNFSHRKHKKFTL